MKKAPMKSLLLGAAVTGLLSVPGVATAQTAPNSNPTLSNSARVLMNNAFLGEKHGCKGQNSCKGQGGCKSGDNGCKGKNSCKGKGGCATDGSKPHFA